MCAKVISVSYTCRAT